MRRKHNEKEKHDETTIMGMPATDALEILLFVVFLAGVLGSIFRERFVYVVFGMIIVLLIYESYQRKKERAVLEKKFDEVMLEKRKQAGI